MSRKLALLVAALPVSCLSFMVGTTDGKHLYASMSSIGERHCGLQIRSGTSYTRLLGSAMKCRWRGVRFPLSGDRFNGFSF